MAKKKNKQLLRPWCWYCEREFEDEKVLMQHQKAKHFKCNMCPRRLNTAGGLAVHIQQVHKLEADNLPRIDNALPGRDGYEVEIFGMEGIPAPDVADYKRRKEIELGLNPGSISQPQAKRPKTEHRPLTEDELRAQLEAHKALMGASEAPAPAQDASPQGAVYGAGPTQYAAPPTPAAPVAPPPIPGAMSPPGAPPFMPGAPPPGFPGAPPFPMPPFPGAPPGMPGASPPGFPPFPPPPGMMPPMPGMPGMPMPPFPPPPGMALPPGFPPFPPPPGMSPPGMPSMNMGTPPIIPGATPRPPSAAATPFAPGGYASPPTFVPQSQPPQRQQSLAQVPQLRIPDPSLAQTNPDLKKKTDLKWSDANFSPEEKRAVHPRYYIAKDTPPSAPESKTDGHGAQVSPEESRGKKRARAEDFL
ncbi:unnamed protein product [Peniophora sp. CBMAI 1063]|nr:unnamed protein product [Peniophora sp. CBMAI 1063]